MPAAMREELEKSLRKAVPFGPRRPWDETKVRRYPKGSRQGGRFAPSKPWRRVPELRNEEVPLGKVEGWDFYFVDGFLYGRDPEDGEYYVFGERMGDSPRAEVIEHADSLIADYDDLSEAYESGELDFTGAMRETIQRKIDEGKLRPEVGARNWWDDFVSKGVREALEKSLRKAASFGPRRPWDETKVKRHPRGSRQGGRFAPKKPWRQAADMIEEEVDLGEMVEGWKFHYVDGYIYGLDPETGEYYVFGKPRGPHVFAESNCSIYIYDYDDLSEAYESGEMSFADAMRTTVQRKLEEGELLPAVPASYWWDRYVPEW